MKQTALKNCPIPGCNSKGHMSSKHIKHTLPYECPLFHNLTTAQCKKILNTRGDVVTSKKRPREYYDSILDWQLEPCQLEKEREKKDLKIPLEFSREPLLEGYASSNCFLFFRKAQIMLCSNPLAVEKSSEELEELAKEAQGERKFCVQQVQIGDYLLDVSYAAPLPSPLCYNHVLYACEFCFKLTADFGAFQRHVAKCTLTNPPGDEIYRKDELSVFEVDGSSARVYCQNLCMLAKMFIGHKTLIYDVAPFKFYVLTHVDGFAGCHFIGYFSKQKCSDFNLSCILTLPNYQKSGYGRFLIELSYALTLAEGASGTPEKPISDMGLIAYRAYWRAKIIEFLEGRGRARHLSVADLAAKSGINMKDLMATLEEMELIKCAGGEKRIILCSESKLDKFRRPHARLFDAACLKLRTRH